MRQVWLVLIISIARIPLLPAQTATPPEPQSARQALIEMFLGKGEDDFAKHLPDDARHALIHKGETPETSVALRISAIGRQMVAQGGKIETFDAGPNILTSEQNDGHEKFEVVVERDSLLGEEDEIELSIHVYKDGQPEFIPVVPRLIFTLKQEKDIWKLTEVTAAAHMPLTDPDYLKGLRKEQDEANESAARMRVGFISQAETRYLTQHPETGYTCNLSSLFAQPSETGENADYSVPPFANQESNGYRFTLANCNGTPASKYQITAVPVDTESEAKTFCADESGTLKSVAGGKPTSCFSRGQVVSGGASPAQGED